MLAVLQVMLVKPHQHLTTKIDEDFGKDKKSHIYQHLMSSTDCSNACSRDCFSILDTA